MRSKICQADRQVSHYLRNLLRPRHLPRQLAQIQDYLLRQVVDRCLDTEDSRLPRGFQLLKLALKISGYPDIKLIPNDSPIAGSPVWVQHQALKDQFYRHSLFDPTAWNALINQAKSDYLYFTTETIRISFQGIQKPNSPLDCARYADWNVLK